MISHQMVFIGGLHRSGTSLVHEILRGSPEATGFTGTGFPQDEGQFLQTVYPRASEFGGPGSASTEPRTWTRATRWPPRQMPTSFTRSGRSTGT